MTWTMILDPALSGRVCLVLAHSVWQLALLASLAWTVGRLGRLSVERSYLVHVAALVVGLLAMPVTYALVDVGIPAAAATEGRDAASDPSSVLPIEFAPDAMLWPDEGARTAAVPLDSGLTTPAPATSAVNVGGPSSLWLRIAPGMVTIYAAGVALMLARLIRGIGHARRLAAAARPVDDAALVERLDRLVRQWSLRVAPSLSWVEEIAVPKVIGLVRPTILLPVSAVTCLSADELEMILAHELAHVRRHDMWVNLLQRVAEIVLFFNPGLWYLSRRISTLREYCCDELACRAISAAEGQPRTRYASALVRVAELSKPGNRRGAPAEALAADGRSPSDLRRRIARLFGEPLDEPLRLSRGGLIAMALTAALLVAAPTTWQSAAEPVAEKTDDAAQADEIPMKRTEEDAASAVEKAFAEAERVEMSIVVARHVLLLEGKQIITWDELDKKIAALPDPSAAYPHFYLTRGTYEAGGEAKAKQEMFRLHGKYNLQGHSEGSLWPRADLRYDRIKTAADLVPDEGLRIEGRVIDGESAPVAGAEVLLVTPVDESIPYKSIHIELVEGQVRNRLEHVMALSDEQGQYALHPPKDSPYYVVVLHPKQGFALVRHEQFKENREIRLLAWAELVSRLGPDAGQRQESSIRSRVGEADGLPELIFNQYWSDLNREPEAGQFRFTHVPPLLATTITRDFSGDQGSSFSLPGATLELMPGERRELGLGPLSQQQAQQLEDMRRDSRARSERSSEAPVPASLTPTDSNWQFELRVIGPDGKPVPQATVQIRTQPKATAEDVRQGLFERQGPYGVFIKTDVEGRVVISRPEKAGSLTVLIEQPGYGPYWAEWKLGNGPQKTPLAVTAELDAGWTVGGVIVDGAGQPVEGATIRPGIRFKDGPGASSQLHVGTKVASDENGRWSYASVPESMREVFVEVSHPAYQPNRRALTRGEFGLAAEGEPSARIVLEAGLVVTGTVRDEAGQPIAGARIRTEFLNDLREATTDVDGTYRLVGCEPRMARVVVSAPGKALEMQEVRVEPGMKPVDFLLRPGGRIRVRVVDGEGKPVAKTRVLFQRWRGPIEYFEFEHVNQYTNEEGVWEWSEAPLDEIRADICPPGGMQLLEQPLVAREEEYIFRALPPLVVSGNVTDTATGQPVKSFRVVPGLRSGIPESPRLEWSRHESSEAVDGRYQLQRNRGYEAHLVRIEAVGYEVAVSRDIGSNEGAVRIDFALKPGRDVASTILTPDGKPAAGAKIALGIAGSQISVENGDIDDGSTYAARQDADEAGRFRFPAQEGAFQLVITHPAGYAYVKSEEGPVPDTITLAPWARVEGTFRVGEQAVSGVPITLNSEAVHSYGPDVASVFTHHDVTTGPEGRLVFERVFPGEGRVGRRIPLLVGEGATEVTSSMMVAMEFKAGETTRIDLGGGGRPVTGTLAPPAGHRGSVLWNFASIYVEVDLPPPDGPITEGRAQPTQYEVYERLRSLSPIFMASVDRDGSFRIDDVPAGEYVLGVRFHKNSAGGLSGYKLSVPGGEGGRSREPVDLGVLTLQEP